MYRSDVLLSEEDFDLYENKIYTSNRYPMMWHITHKGPQKVTVHRVVANRKYMIILPPYQGTGFVIDHINGNTLDCRRENLQFIKQTENILRSAKARGPVPYLRVSFNKNTNRYVAALNVNKEKIHIGYYDDPEEAAYWADVWTVRLAEETAVLNFPENLEYYIQEALKLNCLRPWQRTVDQKEIK